MPKKQVLIQLGAVLAVASGGSLAYYAQSKPTSVLEGTIEIDLPNDGGVATGRIYGLIGPARVLDGGVTSPDAGTKPDAGAPDAGQPDSGPPPTPDAGFPDSGPGGAVQGLFEPSYRGPVIAGDKLTQPAAAAPSIGQWVTDVTHGTRVRRMPGSHTYSQLQAFSADETMVLLQDAAGLRVFERESLQPIVTVSGSIPRWRRGTNKIIYTLDEPARVMELDPRTGKTAQLVDLGARYVYREQSWEDTSADGRLLAAYVHEGNGARASIVSVDLARGAVLARAELSKLGCTGSINWAAPSASGDAVVVQWNGDGWSRCRGVEKWTAATLAYEQHVWNEHPHSDHCTVDRRDYLGSGVNSAPWGANGSPAIAAFFLDRPVPKLNQYGAPVWTSDGTTESATGQVANTVALRTIGWSSFQHVSCKGPAGWMLYTGSTAPVGSPQSDPYAGELWLVRVTAGGSSATVNRLAWHRSTARDYSVQPKATLSPSGRFALFTSDWNGMSPGTSFLVQVID